MALASCCNFVLSMRHIVAGNKKLVGGRPPLLNTCGRVSLPLVSLLAELVACGLRLGDEPSCTGSQLSLSPLIARLLDSDRLIMLMFTVGYIWNSTVPTRPAIFTLVLLFSRRACFF